jgi:aldehyde:ferredoxin oxidoreductase
VLIVLGGFQGFILRVDLTTGKISKERINEHQARLFIGGPGLGAKILYDEVPPWVESFDALNELIFCTGPLCGAGTFSVGRHFILTKSPLTGYFGEANAGGFWGAELKFAGYDMIVIRGRASRPRYLFINDDVCEIRDAKDYWGLDARETDRNIRKDLGDSKIRVATIGQAGENLVLFASVMNDEANRAAARCGVGAVMGFKNLKGIAVRGHKNVPVADESRLRAIARETGQMFQKDTYTKTFHKFGTAGGYEVAVMLGDSPVRNWSGERFEGVENLSFPGGFERVSTGTRTCHNCVIACRRVVSVKDGPFQTENGVEGPEYESSSALGGNCGVSDIEAVTKANDLCNVYGMDTISAGSAVAFAMECYEKGLINDVDTDGIDLKFGNAPALVEFMKKIAFREGFGNVLADGVKRAAHRIGGGADKYAIHVKGLELGMHDPRAFEAMSLTYACAPTGGRHMEGETLWVEQNMGIPYDEMDLAGLDRLSTDRKAEAAFKVQNVWTALSASGYCLLAAATGTTMYLLSDNLHFLQAVTGWDMNFDELMKAGERIFNVRRAFSMRHGATVDEDTLPERLLHEPVKFGPSKGSVARLDEMLPEFYALRGWDPQNGKPTKEKLLELGLDDIARDLWA